MPQASATPLNIVARLFREAHILPSWHGLQMYATPKAREVSMETLEICGSRLIRDPERRYMHTEYDDHGPAVMWFGSTRGATNKNKPPKNVPWRLRLCFTSAG